jgi:multiple sugar transport system permease protein
MMLPWQVTMVPLFITYKNFGWINTYLPLVVPALFSHPYFVFMLRQFFLSIPEELSDAARIDGASELGIFFRLILPLSVPALAVVVLFRFLWSWNDYLGPLIYLNNDDLYPIALGIERLRRTATGMGNTALAYPHLMAVSTIVALPIILVFFIAQRTFIEGISTTGLKG